LQDRERSGRPAVVDDDQILTLIERHRRDTTPHISYECYKAFEDTWVYKSLRYLGASQFDGKNLMDCISICDSLLKRNENLFLKRIITGDEK